MSNLGSLASVRRLFGTIVSLFFRINTLRMLSVMLVCIFSLGEDGGLDSISEQVPNDLVRAALLVKRT